MAELSLAHPHPNSINLLRNCNPASPLTPFDGNVGAFAHLGAEHYFITTNADFVPAIPWPLKESHSVYLRMDMRYGPDDPTLWPQEYTPQYPHMAFISKKGARPELDIMWYNPTKQDFVVGSAITRGLGRLSLRIFSALLPPLNDLVRRCTELQLKKTLAPIFAQVMQHLTLLIEQLQCLPTTFPKMLFALTSFQRAFLELDALYEFETVYEHKMKFYIGPSATGRALAKCVGAFTTIPSYTQLLWAAGIPVWLVRPVEVFDIENILKVVPLQEPRFGLADDAAHGEGAPPALYSGLNTRDKIKAIHEAAVHTPWYRNPFETGFNRESSPARELTTPVATSSRSVAPPSAPVSAIASRNRPTTTRYRPYPPKTAAKSPAKQTERDKFKAIAAPEMPPSIDSMAIALAQVDRDIEPYTSDAADKRYVLPEPALFISTVADRTRRALHHWTLLSQGFIYVLIKQPQLLRPQDWRDILEGHLGRRGAVDSKEYKRGQRLEQTIRPALEICGIDDVTDFRNTQVPVFTPREAQEIIWPVAESNFRFEFCALDKRASGKDRLEEVKKCFAGRMLVNVPLGMSTVGWASSSLQERHRYVARTATLMLDWKTKTACPTIIRRISDHHPWSPIQMQDLEVAVCRYYTQAFWEHFGRAAVVPLRLDEKEEGEM